MRAGRRGFTLVEVLVTAALISVALAVAAALVVTAMNAAARVSLLGEAELLGLAVYDYYEKRLSTATAIALEGEAPPGWHSLEAVGGRIEADGAALYPQDVYGSFQVSVAARPAGGALMLTVTVSDSGGAAFTKSSALMLLNTAVEEDGQADSAVIYYRVGEGA